jgi:hypothetical protein
MDPRLYLARERRERDLFIKGWFKMHSRTRKQDERAGKFTVVQVRGMCCGVEEGDWDKADLLNLVIPHMHNLIINKCVDGAAQEEVFLEWIHRLASTAKTFAYKANTCVVAWSSATTRVGRCGYLSCDLQPCYCLIG